MNIIKAITLATLTFGSSVGAFAQTASAYQYGMNLDIAQVIAVEAVADSMRRRQPRVRAQLCQGCRTPVHSEVAKFT